VFHKQIEEEIIIKNSRMVYVIKDQEGNFVSGNRRTFTFTDEGWLYLSYTGIATGFSFYSATEKGLKTAEIDLKKLQNINDKYGFGKIFYIKCLEYNSIEEGNFIIDKIFKDKIHNDNKKIVNF